MSGKTTTATRRWLMDEEVVSILGSARHFARRFEQRPFYRVDLNQPWMLAYMAGRPMPARTPAGSAWLNLVAKVTKAGATVQRVRVFEEPPTPYQRAMFEYSADNVAAGEKQRYLTRSHATALGLTPDVTGDWWWVDNALLVYQFDPMDRPSVEYIDDHTAVEQVSQWWATGWSAAEPWQHLPTC